MARFNFRKWKQKNGISEWKPRGKRISMAKKKEKKVLNQKPDWGQIYAYCNDEMITIDEIAYSERIKDIDFGIDEAKSLLELLPKLIAQAEENKRRNDEEE